MDDIQKQLEELRGGQEKILRHLGQMNGTIKDTLVEIGGVPGIGRDPSRASVRRRLHQLENDRTSARVAATAVDAAKELRASAGEKRFSRREKWVGLLLAAIVAVGPYVDRYIH